MRPVTAARRIVRAVALVVAATAWSTPPPALAAGDCTLLLPSPASQLLPPGGAVAFAVEVGAIGGFADPVQLSVGSLPAGVTSVLSETTVTPPATVTLTLSATEDAAVGDFSLVVTGTSGGLSHSTTGSVTVDFGLVPICVGHMRGTVTDEETGEPIEGARVNGELTDAAGNWGPIDVGLGENNSPVPASVFATKDGYWNKFGQVDVVVVRGQTTTVNLTLLQWQPAHITGHVVLQHARPGRPGPHTRGPRGRPLGGRQRLRRRATEASSSDLSDEHGAFKLDLPFLGFRNTGLSFSVGPASTATGPPSSAPRARSTRARPWTSSSRWSRSCTGRHYGSRQAGRHALSGGGRDRDRDLRDGLQDRDHGRRRTGVLPVSAARLQQPGHRLLVGAQPPLRDYHPGGAETRLTGCDDNHAVEILLDPDAFGSIKGFVHDEETDAPVAGVSVGFPCEPCDFSEATTDDAGHYRISHIPADPPFSWFVRANHVDYWPVADTVTVNPNETTRLDFVVLRVRHASVSGVVRDAVTGEPLPDAGVAAGGPSVHTDADGAYAIDPLYLGDRNSAVDGSLSAGAGGYWPQTKSIHYSADEAVVLDFELLKVCDGATIRGHVVDFVTGLPIEGTQVTAAGGFDLTDADGAFVLSNVPVGTDNSPNEVSVGVSAKGYFSQSKKVTVFCGAHFQLDFAPPAPTSSLEGTVTNAVTGDPIKGVTVIGEWGGQTQSDAHGDYAFDTVPLQADGADHAWDVSALTDDCGQATKTFTARANSTPPALTSPSAQTRKIIRRSRWRSRDRWPPAPTTSRTRARPSPIR